MKTIMVYLTCSLYVLVSDPYVKVYMLVNGQKVAKKKTHVKKRTLAPVYNESFLFDLPAGQDPAVLEQVSFEQRACRKASRTHVGRPPFVGELRVHDDGLGSSDEK